MGWSDQQLDGKISKEQPVAEKSGVDGLTCVFLHSELLQLNVLEMLLLRKCDIDFFPDISC